MGVFATSTSFRRLVAKTLATQFMSDVEKACAPFQFALSTRTGIVWDTPCELSPITGGGVGSANMEEENKGTPRPQKFRKAIHNAQTEVKVLPFEGEFLFAFLDDIKVLAKPGSIREVYGLLGEPH